MTRVPTGSPRCLYPLTFGWEAISVSVSLKGGSPDEYLLEPVTGAAVVYDDAWVLIDTGFNVDTIRDQQKRLAHYIWESYAPLITTGDPLLHQVDACGLRWADLAFCAISHLHCDHSGGLHHLVGGPPIVMQQREYEFALSDAGLQHAYFRTDYEIEGLTWSLVDGEEELAPGLIALPTFGHTPGHMSFAISLPSGKTVVLACDAADLRRNIDLAIPCGTTTHPGLEEAAAQSIQQLRTLDQRSDTEVWPGHDPDFWPTRSPTQPPHPVR